MERTRSIPLGVIVRRHKSSHRWGGWVWAPVAVIPRAPDADWILLREEDGVSEYHAATLPLELFRGETEAYRLSLSKDPPLVWVVLRRTIEPGEREVYVHCVTASPYEAQDYLDSGEDIVEPVAMPPMLAEWVREFSDAHHREVEFRKRRRDSVRTDAVDAGRGDARIRQPADVYRAPAATRPSAPKPEGEAS